MWPSCVDRSFRLTPFPPLHTRQHKPEGSLYVMHNEAVTKLDHAVSAPHAVFKVPYLPTLCAGVHVYVCLGA